MLHFIQKNDFDLQKNLDDFRVLDVVRDSSFAMPTNIYFSYYTWVKYLLLSWEKTFVLFS